MKYNHFEIETIGTEARRNITAKFRAAYTQGDLESLYKYNLPAFVRWNNRNVYGLVFYNGSLFFVSNFYRLKRDGTPVRMYLDLVSD